jgi:hypothetical protein
MISRVFATKHYLCVRRYTRKMDSLHLLIFYSSLVSEILTPTLEGRPFQIFVSINHPPYSNGVQHIGSREVHATSGAT